MTRRTNAGIAGFTLLFYIAVALPSMMLMSRATRGEGIAPKLASIAEHASDVRVVILLTFLSCLSAIVLAVTLYGITRDEDHELSMLVLACRVSEGVLGMVGVPSTLGLLWLATAGKGLGGPDPATANTLGWTFLTPPQSVMLGAPFFAVGSLIFSYLLLRGRMVPVWLAWIGLISSAFVVVGQPLQLADLLKGPLTEYMWFPMLAFEVPLGLWLLIKGVAPVRPRNPIRASEM